MAELDELPPDFVKTFKRHIKFVNFIGIDIFDNSKANFFRKFWKLIIVYIALITTVCGQYLYLFLSHRTNANFLDVINALPGTLMATQDIVKLCIVTIKRNDIRHVILEIAKLWPIDSNKVDTLHIWTRRLSLFEQLFYYCGYVAIIFFLCVPLLTTIYTGLTSSKIVYQFPLDTYFFSFLESHLAYVIAYIFISAVCCTVHMCLYIAIDFILTSITFDVSGLLTALQNDFNNLQQDDKGTEDDYSRLKENVINHQKLLSIVNKLNVIFGPLLFAQVTFSSIVICCFGFLTIIGKDLIKSLLATFGIILAMFNFCWSGQLLSDASCGIAEAAYNYPWYKRNVAFRKYIQIIIVRTQKPCILSALGFSDVSLSTLFKLLSTSWSYLSLLNQMYEDIM